MSLAYDSHLTPGQVSLEASLKGEFESIRTGMFRRLFRGRNKVGPTNVENELKSLPSYDKDGVLSYSLDIVNGDELKLWIQATVDKSVKLDGAVNYEAMRAQGAVIVDVGGVLGIVGLEGNAPYSASK
ncbi:putative NAD(P)-binding protein [Seiridium cardinale]|uniref:NAD(P)-binding protein n=1 Tax=Seiridium cardinale TaxID=138064 RepID=A0ABR2Y3U6_9PEZI